MTPRLIMGLARTKRIIGDRLVRYLLAGGISAVLYYGVFAAGWAALGAHVPYVAMAVLANLVTAPPTYQIQRHLVFRATGPWFRGFLRFYVLCLGSLACVTIGLPVLVEVAGLPVLVAQALVIGGSPLVNYQLARLWAFRAGEGGAVARTTSPLAATAASGCRASTTSSTLSGDNTHISGTRIR